MHILQSHKIPAPKGHYSPAISHGGFLFISGQVPFTKEQAVSVEIEEQTRITLQKVATILEAAGCQRSDVLQCRIYISDMSLWARVNAVYADFFGDHKPTRCIVPVGELHYGCLIEMEALAIHPGA